MYLLKVITVCFPAAMPPCIDFEPDDGTGYQTRAACEKAGFDIGENIATFTAFQRRYAGGTEWSVGVKCEGEDAA